VLSEGLNLQDATRLINYDLHWNPVRLMQRIGRVDRRMDPAVEAAIATDHPDRATIRGNVIYWNFLPPDELDDLLKLYAKVAHKTLRISKTFGIEGKKLLRPEDDFEALRDFTHAYEGTTSPLEEMHLEYQRLLKEYPDLVERLTALPGRVFIPAQFTITVIGGRLTSPTCRRYRNFFPSLSGTTVPASFWRPETCFPDLSVTMTGTRTKSVRAVSFANSCGGRATRFSETAGSFWELECDGC